MKASENLGETISSLIIIYLHIVVTSSLFVNAGKVTRSCGRENGKSDPEACVLSPRDLVCLGS